ncbi:hypothetical protein D3C87_79830 [compost metagenome]
MKFTKTNVKTFLTSFKEMEKKLHKLVKFQSEIKYPNAFCTYRGFNYDEKNNEIDINVELYEDQDTDFKIFNFNAAILYDEKMFLELENKYNEAIKVKENRELTERLNASIMQEESEKELFKKLLEKYGEMEI